MPHFQRKFLVILDNELDKLRCDLEEMVNLFLKEQEAGKTAESVCQKNVHILKNGLSFLEEFQQKMREATPERPSTLEDLLVAVREAFRSHLRDHSLYELIIPNIDRRLDKIEGYVNQ